TVSVVFELLGAAVAISMAKIISLGQNMGELVTYINTTKALAIVFGILVSVIVAFTAGAILQAIARFVFTFDYERRIKKYGSIFAGVAFAIIIYFALIKGAKGSSWMTDDTITWIMQHSTLILGGTFVVCTILLQLLNWLFKVNVLKLVVLVGTAALAMAFSANDLVNFIGVPLAGFHAYRLALANPVDPLNTSMAPMAGEVSTATWMLLIAGAIMVVTLWTSKKARSVVLTSVRLGRQQEGYEKFPVLGITRPIVRFGIAAAAFCNKYLPTSFVQSIARRFDASVIDHKYKKKKDCPEFDIIRASTILVAASALIAFGTSLKLPLSTTYVTFMVAMGASLADRAWGRESAVYRVSGVITIIAGWFFTAFIAFSGSFIFAWLIHWLRLGGIIALCLLAIYFVIKTHRIHQKREAAEKAVDDGLEHLSYEDKLTQECTRFFTNVNKLFSDIIDGVLTEDAKALKNVHQDARALKKNSRAVISTLISDIQREVPHIELSPRIVAAIGSVGRHIDDMAEMCYLHIVNQHKPFSQEQAEDIRQAHETVKKYLEKGIALMEADDNAGIAKAVHNIKGINEKIADLSRDHIRRVKKGEAKTRQSMLFFNILIHSEDIAEEYVELLKGYNETFAAE
ncbi:inorganic phosphate transporter, partial [candidate division KSB1 bacterium]|nr:inorganic phosphate transporter [candidate division KSB1 bacterium]